MSLISSNVVGNDAPIIQVLERDKFEEQENVPVHLRFNKCPRARFVHLWKGLLQEVPTLQIFISSPTSLVTCRASSGNASTIKTPSVHFDQTNSLIIQDRVATVRRRGRNCGKYSRVNTIELRNLFVSCFVIYLYR